MVHYNRGAKFRLYAEAEIPEYWIVNLIDKIIEVYTNPSQGKYQSMRNAKRGERLQVPGGPWGEVAVNDILG